MDLFDILTMIGGLSLFLFGMNIMGEALERAAFSAGETDHQPDAGISDGSCGDSCDPVLLSYHGHGGGLC